MDCNRRVLVVEGMGAVRRALEREGIPDHELVVVDSSEEGLQVYRPGEFCCLLVGFEQPKMSGLDFVRAVRMADARVGVVLVARDPASLDAAVEGLDVYSVLKRPPVRETLLAKLEEACELATMTPEREEAIGQFLDTGVRRLKEKRHALMGDTRVMTQEMMQQELEDSQ